ncbi:glutathione peroxidase [Chania multitudinisentens RB-25]|uniref:Glutathione peroxidase n=1 Tax=Chania multitudinisentens RB-25 TaxID=1441930 RepID=W0LK49_9GAMM|nr:glutathione peroxidase [Chania multitudinisentens]AHG22355.1 glutathione peroxidase [Chania multitudinisentens RB-25]
MNSALLSHPCITLQGEHKTLADFPARAYLVVNTASQCGFTPQYQGLEHLWQRYRERGLAVLAFPCNQFGRQEPGNAAEIADFCALNYGVSFPLFSKIEVNGVDTHPLFSELKRRAPGLLGSQRIKWNFTKFLFAANGEQIMRFAPFTKPEQLSNHIELLLR